MDTEKILQSIAALDSTAQARGKADRPAVQVAADKLVSVMERLRDGEEFAFDMLLDHTAVDWVDQGCFELVYNLYSTRYGHYAMVTAMVPRDNPVAPSLSGVWAAAQHQERECYDLMGVLYDGHPDLRRVFLEDDWKGHPLRKDYQDDYMLELPK